MNPTAPPPARHHRGRGLVVLAVAAVVATAPLTARAVSTDTADPPTVVHLANGDRLSGTVEGLEDGTLSLATPYAGGVEIAWSAVVRLRSAEPVTVVLADGTRVTGRLESPADGSLEITPEAPDGTLDAALADVTALNPPAAPPVRLRGNVSAAVAATSGNSESERTLLSGELVAATGSNRFTVGATVNEASEDGRDTVSRTSGRLGYDHFLGEHWYFNVNASLLEDEFQDLNLRTAVGAGAGYRFAPDDDAVRLDAELGASSVNDDFLTAPDEDYPAARWSLDAARRVLGGEVELFHRHEVLQSLDDSDDLLLRTRTGARFSLWKGFAASLQLDWDRDESPAPGRDEDDRTWSLNLGYEW